MTFLPSLVWHIHSRDGAENNDTQGVVAGNAGQYTYSMNKLNQPIYILPGQTFENKFIPLTAITGTSITGGGDNLVSGDSVVGFYYLFCIRRS